MKLIDQDVSSKMISLRRREVFHVKCDRQDVLLRGVKTEVGVKGCFEEGIGL